MHRVWEVIPWHVTAPGSLSAPELALLQLKTSILAGERELEEMVVFMSGKFRTQSAKGRVIAS